MWVDNVMTKAAVPVMTGGAAFFNAEEGGIMVETYEKGKLYQLPLTRLSPDPEQPRKFFDEQSLAELAASISQSICYGIKEK